MKYIKLVVYVMKKYYISNHKQNNVMLKAYTPIMLYIITNIKVRKQKSLALEPRKIYNFLCIPAH